MRIPVMLTRGLTVTPRLLLARADLAEELAATGRLDQRPVFIVAPDQVAAYVDRGARVYVWDGLELRGGRTG